MEARWVVIILAVVVICGIWMTASSKARYLNNISRVSYASDAGTILPELQWHEEIVITGDGASLIRNGRTPDTEINEGAWGLAVDELEVTALFERLEAVDCTTIKRIESESQIDGGDTESYTIVYTGGKTLSLIMIRGQAILTVS